MVCKRRQAIPRQAPMRSGEVIAAPRQVPFRLGGAMVVMKLACFRKGINAEGAWWSLDLLKGCLLSLDYD